MKSSECNIFRAAGAVCLVLLASAMAQSRPTTAQVATTAPSATAAPATRLATTRLAGEGNPKRTLTMYAVAMSAGDAKAVRDSYYVENDRERAVVDAYARLAESVGALRKAATSRFGPDGFDNIGFGKMFADQVKVLEQTRVFVDGPKALAFTDKDDKPDLRLVRVEAGWKISATTFVNPARTAARINAQAGAYEELAAEIAAEKYRLATDARVAGRSKVMQAMERAEQQLTAAAATQPAAADDGQGKAAGQPAGATAK